MMLCAKFGGNWPSGYGGKDEIGKSLQTDGLYTVYIQVIRKSSLELSAQVSEKGITYIFGNKAWLHLKPFKAFFDIQDC